jgi:hypothetical protein
VSTSRHPLHRLVDLAAAAPVVVLNGLYKDLPKLVRERRQAIENRIQLAHWIGRIAVQQGQKELVKKIGATRPADVSDEMSAASTPEHPGMEAGGSEAGTGVDASVVEPMDSVPASLDADQLPISGYESLAALHVVQRLAGLRADELDAVRRFELAHRGRRTILAKIEQLQGA